MTHLIKVLNPSSCSAIVHTRIATHKTRFINITVIFSPSLCLLAGDDLADVLDGELPLLDGVQRLDAPAAAIIRAVD